MGIAMANCLTNVTQFTDLPTEIIQKIAGHLNAKEYSFLRETCPQFCDKLVSISTMEQLLKGAIREKAKQFFEKMVFEKEYLTLLRLSSPRILEALVNISENKTKEGDKQYLTVDIPKFGCIVPGHISNFCKLPELKHNYALFSIKYKLFR
ncbi:hypothetical protein ABK905_14225 [Acerihabitans sp. KWT182]|uniref:F-box domain-containing protein n=1 Tax=Acerihabitans sp. KWT182 TaxID=3157919 RepID=A0AAU7Q5M4_9GAMM